MKKKDKLQFEGKVSLVTGGGTGIGAAVANQFAEAGATVIICGRNEERLQASIEMMTNHQSVHAYQLDVSKRSQVDVLVGEIIDRFGRIDFLINNAGVNVVDRSINQLSPKDWDYIMDVNSTGVFNVTHAVLPHMRTSKNGMIISIGSIAGCRPSELGGSAYSASKHAMTAFTKVIGLEEGKNGIRATVIAPGEVDTPLLEARPVPVTAEHRDRILQPEDVAASVLFVAMLPPRAHVPELIIKPTFQAFS